ncbi:MAG: DNA recombination protein RmuC [Candidatus Saccharimonadales bacterium]|jgi:DNA recombination protein RmuC
MFKFYHNLEQNCANINLMVILTSLAVLLAIILIALILNLTIKLGRDGVSSEISSNYLKKDIDGVSQNLRELQNSLQEKISEKLERSQNQTNQTIQRQFEQSAKIIADVQKQLTQLDETNKQVKDVAGDLKTLQNVLTNPKQRGVLGEYYLETVLKNVLPPERFQLQFKFKDNETVDAVIFLEKDKVLPIDSKFSLENYNRLVGMNTGTEERAKLERQFKNDLKLRIDETAKYIRPEEDTMDFAFMFIPSEAIYYDLLVNKIGSNTVSSRDLIEYAFREKHVIIVSPTSFMAYLQTVIQGLRSLQIEEQAKEIQKRVGELGRHLKVYQDYQKKLGNSLKTTVNHYNASEKEFKKLDKDVVKINGGDQFYYEVDLLESPSYDD